MTAAHTYAYTFWVIVTWEVGQALAAWLLS
jgi:hypothetical protein